MRVIAGKFGSRPLKGPGKIRLRPTSDQLRETLFNILGPGIEDALFVDVYAGTGAVGIEALSRGAREVFFLENHPASLRLLRRNLEEFGIRADVEILEGDAEWGLERLAARHLLADFIFLDPPYDKPEECDRILDSLDTSRLLAPSGRVILEHSRRIYLPEHLQKLERVRFTEQGDSALSFYRLARAA